MSKSKSTVTQNALVRRGWTDELIESLLPKPMYVEDGHVRVWKRKAVRAAEETEEFKAGRVETPPEAVSAGHKAVSAGHKAVSAGQKAVSAVKEADRRAVDVGAVKVMLEDAFARGQWDDSPVSLLAGLYHRAILSRIGRPDRELRRSQITSHLGEFLALEKGRPSTCVIPAVLGLSRSGAFIAAHWFERPCDRLIARYANILKVMCTNIIAELSGVGSEESLTEFLRAPDFPLNALLKEGLSKVWSVWYVPRAIRTSLSLLVALNPKDEYPEARAMRRHFVLHIGGTNTGKTYAGLVRLMEAPTGVYLGPLRLLALEAQETLLDARVDCSLTTGEEEDHRPGDTHVAATAEKLDIKRRFDVAVIDECQMIRDPQRGYAWTRAILGVLAPEIHLCAAPEAENILLELIASCGDTYNVVRHERQVPLVPMRAPVSPERIQPGDALITFSKVGVLSVAEELRSHGKEPAIIYGALPYATRRRQMDGFLKGDMKYIVSTDAIGMGLNLPIRRIIFMETEKFDGTERRQLLPEEIRQIAGRAGRFGMYNRGYVGTTQNLAFIRAGLEAPVPPIEKAVVGFSDMVLQVDFDLLEVLTEWNKLPTAEPYVKLDISRYITIITKLREAGFVLTREQELRAANIPFDETSEALRDLFFDLMARFRGGEEIHVPGLSEEDPTLPELELYYKKLDLYFSFCKAFDLAVDEDRLFETREDVAEDINDILLTRLRSNIRFCAKCGKPLGLYQKSRICDECYRVYRAEHQPSQKKKKKKK